MDATERTDPSLPTTEPWLTRRSWPFATELRSIGGREVAVTDVGAGPTLLFCHAGMWSFVWRDLIVALADRFRCVTFDPPGFGLSPRVTGDALTLDVVRDVTGGIIDLLDLDEVTLVMHDLGGPTAMAAAASRPDRVTGLVAANTFAWRPGGVTFRAMLAVFGSRWMRELDGMTGLLAAATSTRLGVGRRLDRADRRAFRAAMDPAARRGTHRLFASARKSPQLYRQAALAHRSLVDRPLLTVFGSLGDYLGFRRKWRTLYPHITEVTVRRGLHFPMTDDPTRMAEAIAVWHPATSGR